MKVAFGALALALAASMAARAQTAPQLPPVPPGWDACKWSDPAHQTPKYVVGRIVASYRPSPSGLAAALPTINALYPGSAITQPFGDKVDIPCVGLIDLVVNSGGAQNPDSGDSWAWQVVTDKCGACNPNQCEDVSKSIKCGAAASATTTPGGGSSGGANGATSGGATGEASSHTDPLVSPATTGLDPENPASLQAVVDRLNDEGHQASVMMTSSGPSDHKVWLDGAAWTFVSSNGYQAGTYRWDPYIQVAAPSGVAWNACGIPENEPSAGSCKR